MQHLATAGSLLLVAVSPGLAQTTGLIAGVVRTPDSAARGARVELSDIAGHAATTDSTGRFELRDVPPGRYLVVASLSGWNPGARGATVHGGDTVVVTITLGRPTDLPEVVVTARPPPSYLADTATGGTKFPVPLLDLPQTVSVVTQAVIDDRHITDPHELTRNVSGVIATPPYTGNGLNEANFVFRGIPSSSGQTTLRDGFRDFGQIIPLDMASVDHVEFLMGPESVLYGAVGSLGGLANFISKQPLAHRAVELTMSADNHGDVRSTVDLGGPFSSSGKVRYRLNFAGERVRSFTDYTAGSYAFSVAPVVAWQPSSRTEVTLTASYTQRQYRGDPFIPLYGGTFALPVSRFYGEPLTPLSFAQGLHAQLVVTYQVSRAVRLREGLGYSWGRLSDYNYGLDSLNSLQTWVSRDYGHSDESARDASSQTELLTTFMTGRLRNRMVTGLELTTEEHPGFFTNGDSLAPINIEDPAYGAVPTDTANVSHWRDQANQLGLYAQDLVDVGRHLKVMVGARFDFNQSKTNYDLTYDSIPIQTPQATVQHLSPRLGLVYQPGLRTSLYGSWTNSFWPNKNCPECGNPEPFPPELGQQFEVGAKQLFAQGRLGATLAVYQLTKQNIMDNDPSDPSGHRLIVIGGVRSRGISLDASGSPAPGLDVVLAYAFTDSKVIKGNQYFAVGIVEPNQPRNRLSLWSTYTMRSGAIRGAEIGAGLTAADEQYANWNDPRRLPGYTILDALLAYHGRAFGVQLNFTNLTDARSYQGISYYRVAPAASRSVVTSIEYRF